jgi:hypothetical protein
MKWRCTVLPSATRTRAKRSTGTIQRVGRSAPRGQKRYHSLLVLVLDHVNEAEDDRRTDNVRMLCPDCNSRTPTFYRRNVRHARS